MTADRALRGFVGAFVLAGVTLTVLHSRNWVYFLLFVGVMLTQSAITDWCPLLLILEKAGLRRCRPEERPESRPAFSR